MSEPVATQATATSAGAEAQTTTAIGTPAGKSADAVTPVATNTDVVAAKPDGEAAQKPDEKKSVDAKVVPEKYELKIPDGSPVNPSRIEAISALAKQKGLSNDEAQAILQSEHETLSAHVGLQKETLQRKSDQWLADSQADKELGGEKFTENVEVAKRALEHLFPDPEIKKFLNETGLGNHPGILKGFLQMGRKLQNDKIITGSGGQPAAKPNPIAIMYDNPTSPKS